MARDKWFLITVVLILGLLIFFNAKNGIWLQRYIFGNGEKISDEIVRLKTENEILRTSQALKISPQEEKDKIKAHVYSSYPFNFQQEISLDKGSEEGINVGNAVLFNGVFLGRIKSVSDHFSIAQTLFDGHFEIAARIGEKGRDALFVGGNEPKLSLINKDAGISSGDAIYSAAPNLPYGIPIGKIKEFHIIGGESFGEATIELPFFMSDVREVEVIKK